jgi:PAS domain S-box-containing protein
VKETSNIVVITDAQEKIIWANNAFTRVSEYPLEEALNKRPGWLLNGPEKDKKEVNKIKEAVKKEVPVEGDILNYSKTGKKYWAHYNIHPVHDENGKLVKFFSIQTDITEAKRLEEEVIRQKEIRQREKTRATIKGQEKERNEVGQELHDNIQQILGAAKLQLDCAKSMAPDNLEYIQHGIDNVKLSIEEIRKFSKRLVAPRFSETSLIDEIKSQVFNLGISDMVIINARKINEKKLSDAVKLTIFRVIQEQLTNIIKHAKASSVDIRLENDKSKIMLEIKDNGIGFEPAKKRNGIGLNNIRNRVELFDGSVKIQSAPDKGCKLFITIPLKTDDYSPADS